VLAEIGDYLLIGFDSAPDEVLARARPEVRGGRGDQALDVEFVGVNEEPDQRLLVVRLIREVGEDDHPGPRVGPVRGVLREKPARQRREEDDEDQATLRHEGTPGGR